MSTNLTFKKLEEAVEEILDNNNLGECRTCFQTLIKVLDKILLNPSDEKVRSIRVSNANFYNKIASKQGGIDYLLACGFETGGLGEEQRIVLMWEDQNHLIKARNLLRTRAIQDLAVKESDVPVLPVRLPKDWTKVSYSQNSPRHLTASDSPPPLTKPKVDPLPPLKSASTSEALYSDLSGKPVSPPVSPRGTHSLRSKERDTMLDRDFFQFSTQMMRPGGRVYRQDIVKKFILGVTEKYKIGRSSDPILFAIPTELEAELVLFRWNDKYARATVDEEGFYNGFHLIGSTPTTSSSNDNSCDERLKSDSLTSPPKTKPTMSGSTRHQIKPLSTNKLAEIAVMAAANGGRITQPLNEDDTFAVNFQLEQLMLAKSIQESAALVKSVSSRETGREGAEKGDEKAPEIQPSLPWIPKESPQTQSSSSKKATTPTNEPSLTTFSRDAISSDSATNSHQSPYRSKGTAKSTLSLKNIDTIEELVLNGFKRRDVIQAYEIFGDNFDELLNYLSNVSAPPPVVATSTTANDPPLKQISPQPPSSDSAPANRSTQSPSQHRARKKIDAIEELVINGFDRNNVLQAYEIFGDNFDEMLNFLMSQQT